LREITNTGAPNTPHSSPFSPGMIRRPTSRKWIRTFRPGAGNAGRKRWPENPASPLVLATGAGLNLRPRRDVRPIPNGGGTAYGDFAPSRPSNGRFSALLRRTEGPDTQTADFGGLRGKIVNAQRERHAWKRSGWFPFCHQSRPKSLADLGKPKNWPRYLSGPPTVPWWASCVDLQRVFAPGRTLCRNRGPARFTRRRFRANRPRRDQRGAGAPPPSGDRARGRRSTL